MLNSRYTENIKPFENGRLKELIYKAKDLLVIHKSGSLTSTGSFIIKKRNLGECLNSVS